MVTRDGGLLDKIKEKMPWNFQPTLNYIVREPDEEDEEGDLNHNQEWSIETPNYPILCKSKVSNMKRASLESELHRRGENTDGNVDLLKRRLKALINREIESSYTNGDRDFRDGKLLMNVQMDNATPHTGNDNGVLLNDMQQRENINLRFTYQPARSPDLNLNDQSVNRSLASRAVRSTSIFYVANHNSHFSS